MESEIVDTSKMKSERVDNNRKMIIFGVLLFFFFASFATLFGITIYEITKKDKDESLLFLGDPETQLNITSEWVSLYDFLTQNIDKHLKSYKGEYRVYLNNSSGVNFRVLGKNAGSEKVIGSLFTRGNSFLATTIPFNTDGPMENIILQYTSTHNAIVSRIEIEID